MSILAVVVNEQLVMEYHRSVELDDNRSRYLMTLDDKFDEGIELAGETIPRPSVYQRAQCITMSLLEGLMHKEEQITSASLAWLATRLPDLKQVVAVINPQGTNFELVFDREYRPK